MKHQIHGTTITASLCTGHSPAAARPPLHSPLVFITVDQGASSPGFETNTPFASKQSKPGERKHGLLLMKQKMKYLSSPASDFPELACSFQRSRIESCTVKPLRCIFAGSPEPGECYISGLHSNTAASGYSEHLQSVLARWRSPSGWSQLVCVTISRGNSTRQYKCWCSFLCRITDFFTLPTELDVNHSALTSGTALNMFYISVVVFGHLLFYSQVSSLRTSIILPHLIFCTSSV